MKLLLSHPRPEALRTPLPVPPSEEGAGTSKLPRDAGTASARAVGDSIPVPMAWEGGNGGRAASDRLYPQMRLLLNQSTY